ncbi:MAG: thioredoxin-dependent thiol peroxidase [Bacteroidales bacterium]|nr:thioredoxin-dependent thiol peroxidase [Bacteroidales bacterium]
MIELKIGDLAPDFSAPDQSGNIVSLEKFKGKKLVLYFYPKDNTPGCTSEACDLRDNYNVFLDKGYEVLGVSPDSQKSHQNFIKKHDLPFNLVSDVDKNILRAYNAWGKKKMYGKAYEGVLRKTFIISEDGTIENIIEKVNTKEHSKQIFEE